MGDIYLVFALIGAGSIAGLFAGRLPMSSRVAAALALVPIAGIGLTMVFC